MAVLSVRAAAQLTGKSKTTILGAIRSGRLAATKIDGGAFGIERAELCRLYPVANDAVEADDPSGDPPATNVTPVHKDFVSPPAPPLLGMVKTAIEQPRARSDCEVLERNAAEPSPWWFQPFSNVYVYSLATLSIALAYRSTLMDFVTSRVVIHPAEINFPQNAG